MWIKPLWTALKRLRRMRIYIYCKALVFARNKRGEVLSNRENMQWTSPTSLRIQDKTIKSDKVLWERLGSYVRFSQRLTNSDIWERSSPIWIQFARLECFLEMAPKNWSGLLCFDWRLDYGGECWQGLYNQMAKWMKSFITSLRHPTDKEGNQRKPVWILAQKSFSRVT